MSFFGLADGTSFNSLFGTSSSYSNNGNSTILSDYASIKNGSYRKLMSAYYGGNSNVKSMVSTTATSKESAKKLTSIQSHAESLKDTADALYAQGKKSVFNKVTKTNEDGTSSSEYDVDAIYKKVNEFVKSYNDMLDSTEEISSSSIEKSVDNLKSATNSQAKLLAKIGISIKGDGSLSVDEDTFKQADMNTVKSVFNGTGSYGYQVSARASMIDHNAQHEAKKANTYNQKGNYNYNYNYSYNSFI